MIDDDRHLFEKGFCCAVATAVLTGSINKGTAFGLLNTLENGDTFDPSMLDEWGIDEFDAETIRDAQW